MKFLDVILAILSLIFSNLYLNLFSLLLSLFKLISKCEERIRRILVNLVIKHARMRIDKAELGRQDSKLYDFLKYLYTDKAPEILERCGYTYPVALFRAPDSQRTDPNSILGEFRDREERRNTLITRDAQYRLLMKALLVDKKNSLYNGGIYRMINIHNDNGLRIDTEKGHFFDLTDTCYSLEWELLNCWAKLDLSRTSSFDEIFEKLKLRRRLHRTVANPIISGSHRCAGLAISGLIAAPDEEGKILLWVMTRSDTVALNPGQQHVVPSGQFSPLRDHMLEWTDSKGGAKFNFYREYLEEVFSKEDPTLPKPNQKGYRQTMTPWEKLYDDLRLQYLLDLLSDKSKAELILTGAMVNLLTLQPEVCLLLYIKTSEWYITHFNNTDQTMKFNINEEFREGINPLYYSDDDLKMMQDAKLFPQSMVPNGAASFWMGIDLLRSIKNNRLQKY